MEWGHPLVGLVWVQGAGQLFGLIHRAAARNLPSPPTPASSCPSPLTCRSPHLVPTHLTGLGHAKPSLLRLPTSAAILSWRSYQS